MKDSRLPEYRDRIVDEAAEWFALLQEPDVGPEERVAFADWLSASSEHVHEYLALAALHSDINGLPPLQTADDLVRLASAADTNVVTLREAVPALKTSEVSTGRTRTPAAGAIRWLSAAASIALIALACIWWLRQEAVAPVYATAIGEQKSFPLPDGSLVTLNAVSKLEVRFAKEYRDIRLLSGEALFSVAKNPSRPFRVLTGDSVIQAIGTQFNVYHRQAETWVTVVEGAVEIRNADGSVSSGIPSDNVRLTKGQRAHVGERPGAISVSAVDAALDTAWRERRLIFESRPLHEVVAEFNLYNASPIEIRDPALGDVQVSGSFNANDPKSFALFLQEAKLATAAVEREKIVLLPPDGR